MSVPPPCHLLTSAWTLSAHALSVHLQAASLNSVTFARASPPAPPPFFLQPNEARETAARNAIESLVIGIPSESWLRIEVVEHGALDRNETSGFKRRRSLSKRSMAATSRDDCNEPATTDR